jgi:hypothetical protein
MMPAAPVVRSGGRAAVAAETDDLEVMLGRDEPLLLGDPVNPGAQIAADELDDPVTPRAQQVVMVVVAAAEAIAALGGVMAEDLHEAAVDERRQRSIDGRQPDPLASAPKPLEELVSGRVVALFDELGEHQRTLPGRPQAPLE